MAAHFALRPDRPEQWLADHAAGDRRAFERLVEHFRGPICAYLTRCGLAEAEREDLTQEIFLRLHRSAGRYRPERPAKVWVFTVVANCTRSHFRRRAVRERAPVTRALPEPQPSPSADSIHLGRETAKVLQSALDRLSLVQREVVLLSALQAMGLSEIASTLGLPPGTVKTHLHRGRLALAKALARADAIARRESDEL